MGMALIKMNMPGPVAPWDECLNTCISYHFDIEAGCQGEVRVHKIPEGTCMCIEEYHYSCCCNNVEHLPVLDDCGCPLCSDQPGKYCIGSGRYHFVLRDKVTGAPYIPDPSEILVTVHHKLC